MKFYATSTPSISVSLFNTLSAPYALSLSKYRVHQCSLLVIFLAISGDDATNESTGESTGDVYLYCLDVTDSNNILGAKGTSSLSLLQVVYGVSPSDEFGNDIAFSQDGNRLVVGSRSENGQIGAMRIYQ